MKKGGVPNADDATLVRDRPSRKYGLDEHGFEHPDPTPVEMPTRLRLPQRQVDRVRELVRRELSQRAQEEGFESFDEADDFEIEGEDPISPYEEIFEPQSGTPLAKQPLKGDDPPGDPPQAPSAAKPPAPAGDAPPAAGTSPGS